jgi:hypothetical protein
MPGFNQTGPMGQGPRTGRQMGRCTNFGAKRNAESNTNTENSDKKNAGTFWGMGMGLGRGRGGKGRGMGRQNRFRGGN